MTLRQLRRAMGPRYPRPISFLAGRLYRKPLLAFADFLLAWWNGGDLGHFPIEHLWNVDRAISADMVTILDYLSRQPSAVYGNAFGFDGEMRELVQAWRPAIVEG